jgi:hypothetical protein
VPPATRLTVGLLSEDANPDAGDAVSVIVPEKPLMLERLMLAVAEMPAEAVIDGWLVVRVKSTTFTVTVIEWDRVPLVPVMVTA